MKYCIIFLLIQMFSIPGQALTSFENHVLSVSQGMSAFYMYLLTEGDEKYIRQFHRDQIAAESALRKLDAVEFLKLSKSWQTFVSNLEYKVLNDQSIFFETYTRNEYRNYLTNLYLKYDAINRTQKINQGNAFSRVQVLSALLAARSLDVASDIYGSTVLTHDDIQLNPKVIANQIQQDIDYLLSQSLSSLQYSMLRKVRSKFHFIKNTMVDYKTQTAYFLIYGNMRAMNKLFERQSSKVLVNSNY